MAQVLRSVSLEGLERIGSGKVREIFGLDDKLLLVATDRLSAFDVVFPGGIPDKGKVLTQLAAFFFNETRHIIPNHLITVNLDEMPEPIRSRRELEGRATLCRRGKPVALECIVRGYLEGSGWKEYQQTGAICGIKLPAGLKRRSRLPEPIFTPSTKAEHGQHDENVDFDKACEIVGAEMAGKLRDASLAIYKFVHEMLDAKGITIADTKFEFATVGGELVLSDEICTPDSSRFWVKGSFEQGGEPISYDKQYVRDWLETTGWDKRPPAPELPRDVVENTAKRYREIYEKITGKKLE
ncbi:MAG: phosphoribosylaminoimidazolesuccinocarboxamide synthase [Candidatus Sumerlaeia bacterium]